MKFISLIALLAAAQTVQAQMPPQQHIIICFTVVDGKGNPLPLSGEQALQITTYPRFGYGFRRMYNLPQPYITGNNDSRYRFNSFAGYQALSGYPFPDSSYIISGIIREFIIIKPGNGDNDTMRIILRNHQPNTGRRTAFFIMKDVVFKTGTYEMDCSKFTSATKAVYKKQAPVKVFDINHQPEKKETTRISATAFYNYRLPGFTFYNDSLFTRSGEEADGTHRSVIGQGVYQLTPYGITLMYKHASGRLMTATPLQPGGKYTVELRVLDARDSTPVVSASVYTKGHGAETVTDKNGMATLTFSQYAETPVLAVSYIGYGQREIRLQEPGTYSINCMLNNGVYFIDSGKVQKGVFTDFTKEYIGIYWLFRGEVFSMHNQHLAVHRKFYLHKRFKSPSAMLAD